VIDIDDVIEKSNFFRNIQVWPLNDVLNYKGWLDNFSDIEEKKIASCILDFFMFYPKIMINQMLKNTVGSCGNFLTSCFPDWEHDDFKRKCIYSCIPGETINPTDSGYSYLRKLKNVLDIPEKHIIDYKDLFFLLDDLPNDMPIIFVDDFLGSGAQCHKAWNKNSGGPNNKTLSEIAIITGRKFLYAPLVANYIGYNAINKYCHGLSVKTCHVLNKEYNLFDPSCICWNNNNELYLKGTELVYSKSKDLGIPFTGGEEPIDAKGFSEQGLALAFDDDSVPDAIPAIFYWCTDNWTPLIKKGYKR
jgi:hypothetical protein